MVSRANFDKLFDAWVESGYEKDLRPSVDRLDSNKGYSFDNIQLITWRENKKNYYEDVKNGRGINMYMQYIPVISTDNTTKETKEYISIAEASRGTDISPSTIADRCARHIGDGDRYIWRFKSK